MEADLRSIANGEPRFKKILAIRKALAQGAYYVNPDQVADALLNKSVLKKRKGQNERSADPSCVCVPPRFWN